MNIEQLNTISVRNFLGQRPCWLVGFCTSIHLVQIKFRSAKLCSFWKLLSIAAFQAGLRWLFRFKSAWLLSFRASKEIKRALCSRSFQRRCGPVVGCRIDMSCILHFQGTNWSRFLLSSLELHWDRCYFLCSFPGCSWVAPLDCLNQHRAWGAGTYCTSCPGRHPASVKWAFVMGLQRIQRVLRTALRC